MFTSRAEFRLHLRIDNADRRLTPHGRRVGLISDAAWSDFLAKQQRHESMKELLEQTKLTSAMLEKIEQVVNANAYVATAALGCEHDSDGKGDRGFTGGKNGDAGGPVSSSEVNLSAAIGQTCAQLLKRPEVAIEHLAPVLRELMPDFFHREAGDGELSTNHLPSEVRNELKSVETEIKYAGYLQQQQRSIDRLKKAEQRSIPDWFDYASVSGLSREMQEKLARVKPRTLGHASRIPGVTPAAVSLVNVYIEIQGRRREQAAAI